MIILLLSKKWFSECSNIITHLFTIDGKHLGWGYILFRANADSSGLQNDIVYVYIKEPIMS